jgi:hypothetical protein
MLGRPSSIHCRHHARPRPPQRLRNYAPNGRRPRRCVAPPLVSAPAVDSAGSGDRCVRAVQTADTDDFVDMRRVVTRRDRSQRSSTQRFDFAKLDAAPLRKYRRHYKLEVGLS